MFKKIFFLTIFIFSITFVSAEQALFSFSAGITSGGIISSDPEIKEIKTKLENPTPCNIGTSFYINHNPKKQISFFLGADFFSCLNAKNNQSYNNILLNIPFGFKIYPNLKGFGIGAAYVPGIRKDYIKTSENLNYSNKFYNWTNGFKLSFEYNFAHGELSKYLPTLGASWTIMPRGNFQKDNILCAFVLINF